MLGDTTTVQSLGACTRHCSVRVEEKNDGFVHLWVDGTSTHLWVDGTSTLSKIYAGRYKAGDLIAALEPTPEPAKSEQQRVKDALLSIIENENEGDSYARIQAATTIKELL